MTNYQLIEHLKTLPQDAIVAIAGYTGAHNVCRGDVTCKDNKIVIETVVDSGFASREQILAGETYKP